MKVVRAEIPCRDRLQVSFPPNTSDPAQISGLACSECLALIRKLSQDHGDFRNWPAPQGASHSEMQIRELILKSQDQWALPYAHAEICHCRAVPTEVVDQAIVCGAHTMDKIKRWTSASTACGTCSPDVTALLKYRLCQFDPR